MRRTHCVQEERNKRKRYERKEGKTEKDEADKKKIAEEIDGEKSKGREGEKRSVEPPPAENPASVARPVPRQDTVRSVGVPRKALSRVLFPKYLQIKRQTFRI